MLRFENTTEALRRSKKYPGHFPVRASATHAAACQRGFVEQQQRWTQLAPARPAKTSGCMFHNGVEPINCELTHRGALPPYFQASNRRSSRSAREKSSSTIPMITTISPIVKAAL